MSKTEYVQQQEMKGTSGPVVQNKMMNENFDECLQHIRWQFAKGSKCFQGNLSSNSFSYIVSDVLVSTIQREKAHYG